MGCGFSSWRIAVFAMKLLICLYQPQISCVRLFCSFWSTQETIMKTPSRRRRALSAVVIPHVTRTVQSTRYSRYASMVLRRESERWTFIVNFATQLLVCLLKGSLHWCPFDSSDINNLIRGATCQEFNSGSDGWRIALCSPRSELNSIATVIC